MKQVVENNKRRVGRVQSLRGSNAATTHKDRRLKRLRTRKAKDAQARKEYE